MLQTETGLNVLRCSPVLAQLLMSLSCYSMSSFSLRHLLANEQWKTVSVAFHSAVVKLCIALCLDYNDIISFYKEHYNMPAAMYSKALSLSPSLPPAGLILLTHSSHASPSLRLNFHLLITWRSLTSSFYSLLSHLFCSMSTIGYATPPLPLPLLSSQYLVSKACTCLPGVTPPIYSRGRGVQNSVESCGSFTFLRRVQLTVGRLIMLSCSSFTNWHSTFLGWLVVTAAVWSLLYSVVFYHNARMCLMCNTLNCCCRFRWVKST